jgi:antitoxin MazE
MTTSIKRWGNSLGVRLPGGLAKEVRLSEGTPVRIEAKAGRIIITPVRGTRYSLESLVKGIRPENRHESVKTGGALGREVW